jgi:hypothetical protein
MLPEAEYLVRGYLEAVEFAYHEPKVLDLAREQKALLRLGLGPKGRLRLGDHSLVAKRVRL